MHLLNARTAAPDDAGEAVDLGQTPGDVVFLSAADSELACLASAQARRPAGVPSLRLANLLQLGHPMSVDLYVERVIARARLVVLRLLGGRSYWPYGLEQVAAACRAGGIPLAALPGDDQPDPELAGWSTLAPEACHRLWQYGVHGGLDNAHSLLAYAASLLGDDEPWREPAPLLRAGLYWPGLARPGIDDLLDVEVDRHRVAELQKVGEPQAGASCRTVRRGRGEAGELGVGRGQEHDVARRLAEVDRRAGILRRHVAGVEQMHQPRPRRALI